MSGDRLPNDARNVALEVNNRAQDVDRIQVAVAVKE